MTHAIEFYPLDEKKTPVPCPSSHLTLPNCSLNKLEYFRYNHDRFIQNNGNFWWIYLDSLLCLHTTIGPNSIIFIDIPFHLTDEKIFWIARKTKRFERNCMVSRVRWPKSTNSVGYDDTCIPTKKNVFKIEIIFGPKSTFKNDFTANSEFIHVLNGIRSFMST